jgi:hypothetical protein
MFFTPSLNHFSNGPSLIYSTSAGDAIIRYEQVEGFLSDGNFKQNFKKNPERRWKFRAADSPKSLYLPTGSIPAR